MTMFTLVDIRADNPKEGRSQHVAVLPEQNPLSLVFLTPGIWRGRPLSGGCTQDSFRDFSTSVWLRAPLLLLECCCCFFFPVISLELTAHYDLTDDDALDEVCNGSSCQLDWI